MTRRPLRATPLLAAGLAAALATSACTGSDPAASPAAAAPASTLSPAPAPMPAGPTCVRPEAGTGCLPLAPATDRVDLVRPVFSHPTSITNRRHPSGSVQQVIYGGQVGGEPWRAEFTRLPARKAVDWDGRRVDVVTWQYLAYSGGRIDEVALDWFAQADDGAVWYFGEDVFNYADGVVADTDGTWVAGPDRPPGMIMPGSPSVGDVYRPENIPGLVFEEVVVKAVDRTVPGPSGPVTGAVLVTELHLDGKREDKVFAPGYGEFSTGSPEGDLEAAVVAVPTDVRTGPVAATLGALAAATRSAFDAAASRSPADDTAAYRTLQRAWRAHRTPDLPAVLARQVTRDVDALVGADEPAGAREAALRVAQDVLDLQLRYRPLLATDLARLDLWARQLVVDAGAADPAGVAGDVSALEWTRDRIRSALDQETADRIDARLRALRTAADRKELATVRRAAPALAAATAAIQQN